MYLCREGTTTLRFTLAQHCTLVVTVCIYQDCGGGCNLYLLFWVYNPFWDSHHSPWMRISSPAGLISSKAWWATPSATIHAVKQVINCSLIITTSCSVLTFQNSSLSIINIRLKDVSILGWYNGVLRTTTVYGPFSVTKLLHVATDVTQVYKGSVQ